MQGLLSGLGALVLGLGCRLTAAAALGSPKPKTQNLKPETKIVGYDGSTVLVLNPQQVLYRLLTVTK